MKEQNQMQEASRTEIKIAIRKKLEMQKPRQENLLLQIIM
jgi:hypothetical protein